LRPPPYNAGHDLSPVVLRRMKSASYSLARDRWKEQKKVELNLGLT